MLSLLPVELVEHICSFLEPDTRAVLNSVSTELAAINKGYRLAHDKTIYYRWTALGKWYLRECNLPKTAKICSDIAYEGNLALLQWVRQQGCPWDEETCYLAARMGRLNVLQWARKKGCPWHDWHCEAASRQHPDTSRWILDHRSTIAGKTLGHGMGHGLVGYVCVVVGRRRPSSNLPTQDVFINSAQPVLPSKRAGRKMVDKITMSAQRAQSRRK